VENQLAAPATKKEGDKRSPAGVFRLGTAFGTSSLPPYTGKGWPYRKTTPRDFWIDDPQSDNYNRWIRLEEGQALTASAERLQMYPLGLVIEHNTSDTVAGAGSAIFLHPWRDAATATVGCTALKSEDLVEILGWLDEKARPVLIQVAEHVFESRTTSDAP
jgi:L,D-peptidoglycan transpeptidase YkuD (ErfK/YbiS/YcfS/YnhG family)